MKPFPSFEPFFKAAFVDRPNRFLVRCHCDERGPVEAFLPNPGRLRELLFPGVSAYLTESAAEMRKTRYTMIAVERAGSPVFLHTHVNNRVARHLLDAELIPGLEQARVLREEVRVGRSRFDFLLREGRRETLLEVKSVTLFDHGVAMFPDAVTERGRRHLLELAELSTARHQHAVLFLVHAPAPRVFLPDYHTDLAFSRTLFEVRNHLRIIPVAVGWSRNLSLRPRVRQLALPWETIGELLEDGGNYIVIVRRSDGGYAFWVDYAQENLTKEAPRRAAEQWRCVDGSGAKPELHIVPVRGSRDRTKAMNNAFARHFALLPASEIPMFAFPTDPERTEAFQRVLLRYRLRRN